MSKYKTRDDLLEENKRLREKLEAKKNTDTKSLEAEEKELKPNDYITVI